MAKIGHTKARQRLLSWCTQEIKERREQAAIALSKLDEGLQEIINEAKNLSSNRNEKKLHNIIYALSCILRREEYISPMTMGQKWLKELDGNLSKRIKKTYLSENKSRFRSSRITIFSRYAFFSALFSGIGSLPSTAFYGNVLYRTHPTTLNYFSYFPGFFFGSMMSGVLWGGLIPLGYHFGRTYERPRRFLMIFIACFTAFCFSTVAILAFIQNQGKGVIADELGPRKVTILLTEYFAMLSLLFSIPSMLYFLIKEIAIVQHRLPSFLLSVIIMPVIVTLVSALTIPMFTGKGLLEVELWGELLIVFGAAAGTGFVDWWLDRRSKEVSSI